MIVRAARPDAQFLIISNDLARDERLSNAALGLLIRILSYPDNWRVDYRSLAQQCREGERAIRTSLAELREAGYAVLVKWQDERGRWHSQSTVYDSPQTPSSDASLQVTPSGGHRSPVHRSPVGRRLLEELEEELEEGGAPSVRKETRARARAESPPTPEPPPNPNPEPAAPPPPAGDTGGIPPRRCPEHIRTLGPVPACGACKEARLVAEQWEAAHPVSTANARNADTTPKHPACPNCHAPAPAGHCARCARNLAVATPSAVHALRAALPGRQRSPAGRRRECPHGRPVAWLDAAGTVEACPDCRRGVPGPENAAESRVAATG